jgi:hypothetical protein
MMIPVGNGFERGFIVTVDELLHEIEKLSLAEKWAFFKRLVVLLEVDVTSTDKTAYHDFLQQTYGSLQETPLKRYPQGAYEEREFLE